MDYHFFWLKRPPRREKRMVFLSTGGESSDKIAGELGILTNKIVGDLEKTPKIFA